MKIKAYSKINLTLDILSRREDGYHDIDSVMQTLCLADDVSVKKAQDITVVCDGFCGEGVNIAGVAASAFFKKTEINGGAKITIKKRIPVSAGLGGGSADAAAVIRALDKLYGTKLSRDDLIALAKSVGADVPFLLFGGTARIGGIGEKITRLDNMPRFWAVLIKEEQKKSTKDMYEKIDTMPNVQPQTENFISALKKGYVDFECAQNAFFALQPQTETVEIIKKTNPLCVSLSGSGPTLFGLYLGKKQAKNAANTLKKYGMHPIITQFTE